MTTDWGAMIKEIRLERRIDRPTLAQASGVPVRTIAMYEAKVIPNPSIRKIEALLTALGYELDAMRAS